MKFTLGDLLLNRIITVILILISLLCLLPFINVLAMSLSSGNAIQSGIVTFWPIGFNTDFYKKVVGDISMLKSLLFTVELTVVFTVLALSATVFAAYPLSRKRLKGKKTFTVIITFTMYFSGGIIPSYLLVQKLGLLNSIWSLVFPCLINTYFFIIMKTFFGSIQESLMEAAIIDGCTEFGILFKIVLPLSMPVLATLALFYSVERWNTYGDAVFYLSDNSKFTLQLRLRQMILMSQINDKLEGNIKETLNTEGLKSASLLFATAPILIVYPWLQKYFVKGMTIGAVKE